MRTQDMTVGKPVKLLTSFALPLMAGSVFQQAYTLVDTAIVGRYIGVNALASLGACDWYIFLVLSVIMGFIQGYTIIMSQRFGARDIEGLRNAFAMSVFLSALIAAVSVVVSQLMSPVVFRLMNTPDDIYGGALTYSRVFFIGIPVVIAYNLLGGALRALGDSRTPLMAMVVASLLNIALDYLFVVGFGWGIAGAAIATVIAQAVSMVYCLLAVVKVKELKIDRATFRVDWKLCGQLTRLGMPVALQNLVISFGGMLVQRVVNGFGFLFIAGYTATNKLYGVLEMAAISFGSALSVYTGQNMGAKRYARIREGQRAATWLSLAVSAVICALMLLLGRSVLSLFISAEPREYEIVMGYAFDFLRLMSLCLPILYMLYVYRSALQGMGNTVVPMASGFVELAMRLAAAVALSAWIGEYGTYIAEVAAWLGAAVLLAVSYYISIRRLERSGAKEDA